MSKTTPFYIAYLKFAEKALKDPLSFKEGVLEKIAYEPFPENPKEIKEIKKIARKILEKYVKPKKYGLAEKIIEATDIDGYTDYDEDFFYQFGSFRDTTKIHSGEVYQTLDKLDYKKDGGKLTRNVR